MDVYSINDVENLTGIKAHTLRVWERRYKSLVPHRTDTNIRYYDDEHLRKLLNIATLLRHNYKVSTLMTMTDEGINNLVSDLMDASDNPEELETVYINSLISSMLSFDEALFDRVFSNIIVRFGIYNAMLKIVYPFLRKTGVMWSTNNATPSQEHFASAVVRRKLLTAIDGTPTNAHSDKRFLLFLPPDEWHEIGLLFTDFLVRSHSASSLYLGASVPYPSLNVAIERYRPTHLLTFFTSSIPAEINISRLKTLMNEHPALSLILCTDTVLPMRMPGFPQLCILSNPADIFSYVK